MRRMLDPNLLKGWKCILLCEGSKELEQGVHDFTIKIEFLLDDNYLEKCMFESVLPSFRLT